MEHSAGEGKKGMLAECVAQFRAARAGGAELEVRLGTFGDGHFVAGVPHDVFVQLEEDFAATLAPETEGYHELIDYHYCTSRGQTVRTRVTFDAQHLELGVEHLCKRPQASVVLRHDAEGGEAARVACALETPLDEAPPSACVPTHVRVKQRRVFRDVRDGKVVWSYELSKTWSAPSRSAVEHLQHVQAPVYEVECELVDEGGAYLAARTDGAVAESLALKAAVLLGRETTDTLEVLDDAARRKRGRPA